MQAVTHGVMWAMSRTTFRDIVLTGRMQKRARYEEVLGDMEIFQTLSAASRSSIADCLTAEIYQVRCAARCMPCEPHHVVIPTATRWDMEFFRSCPKPTQLYSRLMQLSLSGALCSRP